MSRAEVRGGARVELGPGAQAEHPGLAVEVVEAIHRRAQYWARLPSVRAYRIAAAQASRPRAR